MAIEKGKVGLVEKMLVRVLEELVIVSVIDSNANQDGARDLKCFLQCWPDLIGCSIMKPAAPKASAYLTTSTGPKSTPDVRLYFGCSWTATMS